MARPTAGEQARIDAMRANLPPMPDGVSVDFAVLDPAEIVEQIAAEEAAVFVTAKNFGYYLTDRGEIPACEIDLDWLEQLIADGKVECRYYAIGNELEGVKMPTFLHLRLNVAPLYITIADGGPEFLDQAMDLGVAAVFPERADGRRVFISTGPMKRFARPTVIDPKIGRNDPCPCGSGAKFKRCHGQ